MLIRVAALNRSFTVFKQYARTVKQKVWSQAVAPLTLVGRVRFARVRLLRQFTVLGLKFGTQDFTDLGLLRFLPSQVFLRLLRYSCATLN